MTVYVSNMHKAASQLARPLCASIDEKSTSPAPPGKPPDPDLREVLTSTPWSAILIPGGLAILVILAVLALVLWTK